MQPIPGFDRKLIVYPSIESLFETGVFVSVLVSNESTIWIRSIDTPKGIYYSHIVCYQDGEVTFNNPLIPKHNMGIFIEKVLKMGFVLITEDELKDINVQEHERLLSNKDIINKSDSEPLNYEQMWKDLSKDLFNYCLAMFLDKPRDDAEKLHINEMMSTFNFVKDDMMKELEFRYHFPLLKIQIGEMAYPELCTYIDNNIGDLEFDPTNHDFEYLAEKVYEIKFHTWLEAETVKVNQ